MASDKMLGSFDQKSAPEDNDLLVEYDAAASKVKNVKFGGVWNWIVKKLTSAVINELQTSSKNVVGAINELNSKSLRIVNTNVLDWNAIVEIGIYSGNNAQNMPINHNDVWINAIVLAANGNPKFLSLFAFSAKGMFIRQMDNTRWTEWVQIK